jgi:hypothetical protein
LYLFEYFPTYFRQTQRAWMQTLFGDGLLATVYALWYYLGSTKPPVVLFFVFALVLTAFWSWQALYVRLVPRVRVKRTAVETTVTDKPGVRCSYIQIIPEVLSDAPIEECRGSLLRVWKRAPESTHWQPTLLNEPLEMLWSFRNVPVITLQPCSGQRLNLAWIASDLPKLELAVTTPPHKAHSIFSRPDTFKFDIQITGKDCVPVEYSLEVESGKQWDQLRVKGG